MTEPKRRWNRLSVKTETITPEMATAWLEKNESNRAVSDRVVHEYATDMASGRWHLTGEAIQFDWFDKLLNGQHRLWACVEAGVPFDSLVVRGVDPDAKIVIDTGRKRTLGHYLSMSGEVDAALLAAAITLLMRYERSRFHEAWSPTHEEAVAWLEQNSEIRQSVRIGRRVRQHSIRMTPTAIVAAHYVNFRLDPEAANTFWDRVVDGAGLEVGDPIIALGRWVMLTLAGRDRVGTEIQFAVYLKAMRLWYERKTSRALTFRPSTEEYPSPWDPTRPKVRKGGA